MLQDDDVLECISDVGFTQSVLSAQLADKAIATFHLFIKVKAVVDQFNQGSESAGDLKNIKLLTL